MNAHYERFNQTVAITWPIVLVLIQVLLPHGYSFLFIKEQIPLTNFRA